MRIFLVITLFIIAGCTTTVPVTSEFPTPPQVLMESCGTLQTIDKETVLLSEFLQTVRTNYEKYHNCSDLVKEWQNWFTQQKAIYDKLNK
jgi:hypothetical protein